MALDLQAQIHSLFETGLLPVTAADIAHQHRAVTIPFPSKARRSITARRATAVTIGLAAAGCAAALVASQLSTARPVRPAVLDAAYIRHVADASRVALAHSGQAVLTTTDTIGQRQTSTTEQLTFSGANWSNSSTYTATVNGKLKVRDTGIARLVDGQLYSYDGHAWYHLTGPDAVASMHIPDPRGLLTELAPSARFVRVGGAAVDGVRVEHLRATRLAALPATSLTYMWQAVHSRFGRFTALDVWVDDHGVVRRLAWTVATPTTIVTKLDTATDRIQLIPIPTGGEVLESAVAAFRAIGQPQVITAPPNAIPERCPC